MDAFRGYLDEIGHEALLSPEQERVATAEALVEANLRLVVAIARRYQGRGVDLDDLVQEGNLGLIRAAAGFDAGLGFRFSTYAFPIIRQAVLAAVERQARVIRVPAAPLAEARHATRVTEELTKQLERPPTDAEVALELGVSPEQLRELRQQTEQAVSLDLPVGAEGETELGELVADTTAREPLDAAIGASLHDDVTRALDSLSEREREVVRLRFGLDGRSEPLTLREVAAALHIATERVRQLETRALRKLRRTAVDLRDYAA